MQERKILNKQTSFYNIEKLRSSKANHLKTGAISCSGRISRSWTARGTHLEDRVNTVTPCDNSNSVVHFRGKEDTNLMFQTIRTDLSLSVKIIL